MKNLKSILLIVIALVFYDNAFSQKKDPDVIKRVEPAFWWVGMKSNDLQLLVYGNDIGNSTVSLNYAGVSLVKTNKVENPNYLFLDLQISSTTNAGTFDIVFTKNKKKQVYKYELKQKSLATNRIQGVTDADFIYLIMPDRFANGDLKNDIVKGMNEIALNRDSLFYRHGGDLQGIINKLDYIKDLGITAIWLNPEIENDQPKASYHGYAATDLYSVDRRFGTNALYNEFVNKAHEKGIKIIKDVVHNHVGDQHFLVKDKPSKDFFHDWNGFQRTNYKDGTLMDPYSAAADKKIMTDGWFDTHMPDFNQKNKYVANYLTQNHLWWIENSGLDGFRLDTYAYNDLDFMAEWGKRIKSEYPKFSVFAETWVHGVTNQSFFTQNNNLIDGYNSNLPGVTDFQIYFALTKGLNEDFGWTEGLNRLYHTLSSDFMYEDASRNVNFLDNHDLGRFYSIINQDINKLKMGYAFMMTTRGIPSLYYGSEILMTGYTNPDGLVRSDFPGGWPADKVNKFTKEGRTEKENEAFDYMRKIANWRKENSVVQNGKLMQFYPENGVYVYFRYNENKTVMVIMNQNKKLVNVETARYAERIKSAKSAKNIVTDQVDDSISSIEVPASGVVILELN